MDDLQEKMTAQQPPKSVRILLVGWIMLGTLPTFSKIFGFDYLPSTEWVEKTNVFGLVAGLVTAALTIWMVAKRAKTAQHGEFKKVAGIIGAPFFGYFLGKSAVVIAGPMIFALVAGHHVELPFIVASADHYGSRQCRSPIELQGLPLVFNQLCRISDDVRQRLSAGAHLMVVGHGTSYGVFPKGLRYDRNAVGQEQKTKCKTAQCRTPATKGSGGGSSDFVHPSEMKPQRHHVYPQFALR